MLRQEVPFNFGEWRMDTHEFEAQLRRDGYLDIKTKVIDPGVQTSNHGHLFDTRLLVLEGEATISCGGLQRTYQAGEVMEIAAGVEHSERYGTSRFGFIVGLRHKPAEQPKHDQAATAVPAGDAR